MKDLKKISEILSQSAKGGKVGADWTNQVRGEKSRELLDGILSNRFLNDEDASGSLYQKEEDGNGKKYMMLRSRLKKKMLDEVFYSTLNSKKKSPYETALNESYRNFSIVKTLLSAGAREEAVEILKELYLEAVHFRFTDLILGSARMLRYNASLAGTASDMDKYDRVIDQAGKELDAELYSERVIEVLNLESRFSYSSRQDLVTKTRDHYEKLTALAARFQSHTVHLNSYRAGIRYYEFIQDYEGIIRVCESCEDYLKQNPKFIQPARYAELALFKMDACLHLQDYIKGKEYASVCHLYFNRGFPNWFVFMEYYFLLCLQTRNFDSCLEVFKDVTRHPRFKKVNPERKEKWKLFEAYLNVILPPDKTDDNYKLYKFINEVPIYNRDKKGYNLSILIAQFMLLLKMKDQDRLLLKQDSFRNYFTRYVKKKYNYRSYYFSKMLLAVLRYNFNAGKTEQIARKFMVKLMARTKSYHGDLESLEIIPYEQLWSEVINRLRLNGEGSQYFIQPAAKRGRHKKQISKNMAAAIRYKEAESGFTASVTGIA